MRPRILALATVILAVAPASVAAQTVRFVDVAEEAGVAVQHEALGFTDNAGLDFQNHSGPGATFADLNRDGWLDLLVADGFQRGQGDTQGSHIFYNNGDGTFSELSVGRGLKSGCVANAVLAVDMNNDGFEDVLVSNHFADPSIFRGGMFGVADVSKVSGLPYLFFSSSTKPETYIGPRSTGMAVADYNKDGLLDLYLVNQTTLPDRLVINRDGSFYEDSGLIEPTEPGTGFQPVFIDYDSDGDQDIFVVNDVRVDYLYRNNGRREGWTFTEVAGLHKVEGGASYQENKAMGMGCAVADFDNDLDEDIYVTNFRLNTLFQNPGNWDQVPLNRFTEVAAEKNVDHAWNGWGASFFDADNDGDLDLYLVNGWVEGALEPRQRDTYENPNVFYTNNGPPNYDFSKTTQAAGVDDPAVGRGLTVGDYDRDGDLDMYVTNNTYYDDGSNPILGEPIFTGTHRLYRNDTASGNHWINFRLQGAGPHDSGRGCNRDAIGARAFVTAGGKTQLRVVRAGSGYQGMDSLELEFGLSSETVVEQLRIEWLCGLETVYEDLAVDRFYRVLEEGGIVPSNVGFLSVSARATSQGMKVQWLMDAGIAQPETAIFRGVLPDTRVDRIEAPNISYEGNRGVFYDPNVEIGVEYRYFVTTETADGLNVRSIPVTAKYAPRPPSTRLLPNVPNPFNPSTRLYFELSRAQDIRLEILNLRGRRIRVLHDGFQEAGESFRDWDGSDDQGRPVASGVYFYMLTTESGSTSRKLTLVR